MGRFRSMMERERRLCLFGKLVWPFPKRCYSALNSACCISDLQVNQTWYTDANGRDMQQRRFNYRPTWDLQVTDPFACLCCVWTALTFHFTCFRVAYNFFPVDSSIYIQENGTNGREFVISTDRAQGGASLHNGELMLMVWRPIFLAFVTI